MYKKHLSVLIFAILWLPALAQYNTGMEFGGNLMMADVAIDGPLDTEAAWGIRLGFIGELPFSKNLYLRNGLLINQRGFQFADERWGLNAVDVPINIGFTTNYSASYLRWFVDLGFNLEYYFKAFTKIDGETVDIEIGSGEDQLKPLGFGLNIGSGLQVSRNLKIRLSYYRGLTNLVRFENDEWKNQVLGVSLNYFFQNSRL